MQGRSSSMTEVHLDLYKFKFDFPKILLTANNKETYERRVIPFLSKWSKNHLEKTAK